MESGNEEVLAILLKDLDLDHVRKMFKATREHGMKTLAYFMIGNPTETREMALKTIEFAKELDPDFVHFSVLDALSRDRHLLQGPGGGSVRTRLLGGVRQESHARISNPGFGKNS